MNNDKSLILGFDFGMVNIGVAVGQLITQTASPLTVVKANKGIPVWRQLDEVMSQWNPDACIVGLPTMLDGKEQAITNHARHFAASLEQRYKLPVHTTDERLTTKAARTKIFARFGYKGLQKMSIDSLAATIILEQWINSQY